MMIAPRPGEWNLQCHRTLADQEEAVRRLALAQQVDPAVDALVAPAPRDQPQVRSAQAGQ